MKALMLMSLLLMVACNGGGAGSSSNETPPSNIASVGLELTFADPYDSHTGTTLFHFDGLDLSKPQAEMMDYDLDREMTIPSTIQVSADPSSQITQGLVAKLSLTGNLICHYNYDTSQFVFDYCVGTYGNPSDGDIIMLRDLLDAIVTTANIDIEFDSTAVTNSGGIELKANFQ